MLYKIDDKLYVNVAPSIYVEVILLDNGDIEATQNKIEVNAYTKIEPTTLENEVKKIHKNKPSSTYAMDIKYNKRKK